MTINEMILATIKTKGTKTPKYKEVLEALGYEIINGAEDSNGWSCDGRWEIVVRNNDKEVVGYLCWSKGYDNKASAYLSSNRIRHSARTIHRYNADVNNYGYNADVKDYSKIDYANFIKKHSKDKFEYNRWKIGFGCKTKTELYKEYKKQAEQSLSMARMYAADISNYENKIYQLMKDKEEAQRRQKELSIDVNKYNALAHGLLNK